MIHSFIMHGRKRDEYKAIHRDPNTVRKLSMKAMAWHTLQKELLQRQKQNLAEVTAAAAATESDDAAVVVTTPVSTTDDATATLTQNYTAVEGSNEGNTEFISTTLVLLEKAVTVNPDPIWLWNFRRTMVQKKLMSVSSSTTTVTDKPPTVSTRFIEQICTIFDKEHEISQLGLQNNPKAYAVWHYRKWCIQQQIQMMIPFGNRSSGMDASATSDVVILLLEKELHLCNLLLQKDERNFHCWSYRRFIISCSIYYHEHNTNRSMTTGPEMTGEWKLPEMESDDTNICMGAQITLRRNTSTTRSPDGTEELHSRTAKTSNTSSTILQQEWDFTTQKIYENFSNFSAFHYRSKLLPLMIQIRRGNSDDTVIRTVPFNPIEGDAHDDHGNNVVFQMIHDEFDLITNAIFTEPDDQTAWWYQVFLFHYLTTNVLNRNDTNVTMLVTKYNEQIVQPHIQQVRELQNETNNNSKWVLIGLLQCLQFVKKYHVMCDNTTATATDSGVDMNEINQERRVVLQRLIQIDPDRKERYKYQLLQIR